MWLIISRKADLSCTGIPKRTGQGLLLESRFVPPFQAEVITMEIYAENAARNGFEYLLTKEESWGKDKNLKTEVFTLDIVR